MNHEQIPVYTVLQQSSFSKDTFNTPLKVMNEWILVLTSVTLGTPGKTTDDIPDR